MTVTLKGFQGTISDADMAQMFPQHAPSVLGAGDLLVTAVAGARRVSAAAGTANGPFQKYASDTAQPVDLAPPTTGGKWYALTLDRQWSPTNTVVLKADDLAVTNDGTVPLFPTPAVAAACAALPNQPGTSGSTAGQRQLLALAHVRAADTTITLFDLRLQRTGSGVTRAFSLAALPVLAQAGHLLEGATVSVSQYTLPNGGKHVRSVWERGASIWGPVGDIITDDTGSGAQPARADVYSFAQQPYTVPVGFEAGQGLREVSAQVRYLWGTKYDRSTYEWRPWDSPWKISDPQVSGFVGAKNADPGFGFVRTPVWRYAGGRVTFRGCIRQTNGGVNGNPSIYVALPVAAASGQEYEGAFFGVQGSNPGTLIKMSGRQNGQTFLGLDYWAASGAGQYAYLSRWNMYGNTPVTWNDGSLFYWDFSYDPD